MRYYVLFILITLVTFAFAAEKSPVQMYFQNPTTRSFQDAWNACNQALAKDSTSSSTKILMATIANYEAERLVQELYPNRMNLDAGSKFQLANYFLEKEKYEDAIPLYQSLNDSIPDWSCPWRHKGTALYMTKKYKEAEASLKKAVETNKEHYDAYIWLAKTQYQLKEYKLALQNLETGMKLSPEAENSEDMGFTDDNVTSLHKELKKKLKIKD